jgi:hypothetical protein
MGVVKASARVGWERRQVEAVLAPEGLEQPEVEPAAAPPVLVGLEEESLVRLLESAGGPAHSEAMRYLRHNKRLQTM